MDNTKSLAIFEDRQVRRFYDEATHTWYFSVIDVIGILTDSPDPKDYWYRMKKREKLTGVELSTICRQLKLESPDGKKYATDCAHTQGLLRIIQSVPSPKAEPFKQWLAKVGYERMQEIADPEQSLYRARENRQKLGRSEKWIQQRMTGQETRNKLTDYWQERGLKEPSSKRVKDIIESDLNDLKASILQDNTMLKAMPGNLDPEVINKVLIPKIIQIKYPDLTEEEVEEIRQHVVIDSVVKNAEIKEIGDKRFLLMADKFINIDELHIDLIDRINPFQKAFEVLSKSVTTHVLKLIQESIESTRIQITEDEAIITWPKIKAFYASFSREPSIASLDPLEKRMAEVLIYIKGQKRKQAHGN